MSCCCYSPCIWFLHVSGRNIKDVNARRLYYFLENTDKDFRWRECPENLTAYSGCYYTVIAFLESDNQSCILPQNYNIIVSINNKEYEGSDLNIEQVNGSDLFCEVSTTFLVEEVDHNVTFLALSYSSGSVDNQMCVDLLEVNSEFHFHNIVFF